MTTPHPLTTAAERRLLADLARAKATFQLRTVSAIIAAGDARAAKLTHTPRKPDDPCVRLTEGKEE